MNHSRLWQPQLGIIIAISIIFASCSANDESVARPFEHQYNDYARLLSQHVTEDGWVDYQSLVADSAALHHVIATFERVPPDTLNSFARNQKLAFWINAYNAVTLLSIVDAYPVSSIKEIDGVWDEREWAIAGRSVTLNQIEHEILRKDFDEPRIHFAVNCASIGCPPLIPEPYRPSSLDSQLGNSAEQFLRDPLRNTFHPSEKAAELSEIFQWYGTDFSTQYPSDSPEDQPEELRPALNYIAEALPDS
ncbi:MAG: DUF547 domain-containing protein, partial [candidate division Zixibacteria bacterium]|nr:DUF547 domain-containing protein [candidate division Zixibacteria bacterium]